MQTLLVTGGADATGNLLSSTEIYLDVDSTSAWSYAASLPSARECMVSATLDNSVFVFGEYTSNFTNVFSSPTDFTGGQMEDNGLYLAEVLRYNVVSNSWSQTGNMTEPRRSSAVAVISNEANDGQFCPAEPLPGE